MVGLKDALNIIKERFFAFEEFPFVERHRFPQGVLADVVAVKEADLSEYAASMKGIELEALILELAEAENPSHVDRAVDVLCKRHSTRIMRLVSILFQYRYKEVGMMALIKQIKKECKDKSIAGDSFIKRFSEEENVAIAIAEAVKREGNHIQEFFTEYGIISNSPMAKEVLMEFFSSCEKIGYLINKDFLKSTIVSSETADLSKIITHYLESLTLIEYSDSVNNIILKKLGDPYVSVEWDLYNKEIMDRFSKWSYLWRLKEHCRDRQEKFNILVKYLDYIKTNYKTEFADVLITDYGPLVLADAKDGDAYLYSKVLFEKEIRGMNLEDSIIPTFMRPYSDILTSREFMLSDEDAPCIRLSFEGINRYYVSELLDIKLGLEPDMRRAGLTG